MCYKTYQITTYITSIIADVYSAIWFLYYNIIVDSDKTLVSNFRRKFINETRGVQLYDNSWQSSRFCLHRFPAPDFLVDK